MPVDAVIVGAATSACIYELPLALHAEGLDDADRRAPQHLVARSPTSRAWQRIVEKLQASRRAGHGRRSRSSASTSTSRTRTSRCTRRSSTAGSRNDVKVELEYIDSRGARRGTTPSRRSPSIDAILVPGGFGDRGTEGKIEAIRLRARARHPVLRHLPRHADGGRRVRAQRLRPRGRQLHRVRSRQPHTRSSTSCPTSAASRTRARRCASAPTRARSRPGSLAEAIYGAREISERHRHRYEVNNDYRERLEQGGLVLSRDLARPPPRRDGRATEPPVLRRLPVPPRVQEPSARAAPALRRFVKAAIEHRDARQKTEASSDHPDSTVVH